MSKWSSRLDRLRELIGGGACPACGAGGQGPVRFRMHEQGDPEPRACELCGAEALVFTLTLDNPNNIDMGETE